MKKSITDEQPQNPSKVIITPRPPVSNQPDSVKSLQPEKPFSEDDLKRAKEKEEPVRPVPPAPIPPITPKK